MRRSFDGLMRMAEEHLERNVLKGGLFVFVNRHRDRVRRASETPVSSIGRNSGIRRNRWISGTEAGLDVMSTDERHFGRSTGTGGEAMAC